MANKRFNPKNTSTNVTTHVVKEAMRIVSKDVIAPKVVREGTVHPLKKANNKYK